MLRLAVLSAVVLASAASGLTAQGTQEDYEHSCDNGDLVDCAVLGLIYETGAGGMRDMARALQLYGRACVREVASACRRLALADTTEASPTEENELVRVGFVADAFDGTPLAGAIVRIRDLPSLQDRRYIADASGRVVLDPLPRGRHTISVQRGDYIAMDGQIPVPWYGDFLILMERTLEEEESTDGRIFGQVTEEGTGAGIRDVDVALVVDGATVMRTVTNGDGRFLLGEIEPGEVELVTQRLGYVSRTTALTVEAGRTVEVYQSMSAEPIELAPVQVTVASRFLERSGFYNRALTVSGTRFTFRDPEIQQATFVADVMRRVPGIRVESAQFGTASVAISSRRQAGTSLSPGCRLRPYFNGVALVDFNIELVPPDEIEAIEVYNGLNVPVEYVDEFSPDGGTCGVILIWSRDPRRAR